MKFFGLEKEKYAAIFIGYLLSVSSISLSVNIICFGVLGRSVSFDTIIVEGIFYILLLIAFLANSVRLNNRIIYFILFFVVAGVVSILMDPNTKSYIFGPYDVPIIQRYTPRFFLQCFTGFAAVSYLLLNIHIIIII